MNQNSLKQKLMQSKVFRLPCKTIAYIQRQGVRTAARKIVGYIRLEKKKKDVTVNLYSKAQLEAQRKHVFHRKIRFSILVPLYNTPERFLHEMIQSVLEQTYGCWELCLADGSDAQHPQVESVCREYAQKDERIRYRKLERNLGISGNTNACIDMATGDYIALFDHDDLLHPAALYENMRAICEQDADYIYTDEATFESPDVRKIRVFHFKPDYAPDNLRANNYICHFSVFSRSVLEHAGAFRCEYDGSQDHEMILRLTACAKKIVHIPKILYYWRSHPQSVAQDIHSKTYAIDAGQRAVRDHLAGMGMKAEVESSRAFPSIYRIRYHLQTDALVSVIITRTADETQLRRCLDSVFSLTTYRHYEIVLVDRGDRDLQAMAASEECRESGRIRICRVDPAASDAQAANQAISSAKGEYAILLDAAAQVITPEWIEEMLMYVQRDDVAAAGAMLYRPDETICDTGVVLGLGKERTAAPAFVGQPRGHLGYMGNCCYARNVSAVSGRCMMVKTSVYRELGGLDDGFGAFYGAADLCMRMRKNGYLIVWTPFAELYDDGAESGCMEAAPFRNRWSGELEMGDPYYNPNFDAKNIFDMT